MKNEKQFSQQNNSNIFKVDWNSKKIENFSWKLNLAGEMMKNMNKSNKKFFRKSGKLMENSNENLSELENFLL